MQRILSRQSGSVISKFTEKSTLDIGQNSPQCIQILALWDVALQQTNPFNFGDRFQDWRANQSFVKHLYQSGWTEEEILSFAKFGAKEVAQWD